MATKGGLLVALGALGLGLLALDSQNSPGGGIFGNGRSSGAPGGPGGGPSSPADDLLHDPGGGTPFAPPNPITTFPVPGVGGGSAFSFGSGGTTPGAGPGSSSVPVAAAAGAANAPPAGQAAVARALVPGRTGPQVPPPGPTPTGPISIVARLGAAAPGFRDTPAPPPVDYAAIGRFAPIGGPNQSTVGRGRYVAPVGASNPIVRHVGAAAPGFGGLGDLTPTQLAAQTAEQARVAAIRAVLAQPHPSIATRRISPPPVPSAPPPAFRAPVPRRTGPQIA